MAPPAAQAWQATVNRQRDERLDRTVAFLDKGDVLGHEPMGWWRRSAPRSPTRPRGPGGGPVHDRLRALLMCDQGLQSQCETTRVREQGKGAALFGCTRLYGQVPGGQAEYLRGAPGPGGSVAVLGLGPIGDMSAGIALHRGPAGSSASTWSPNASSGPGPAGSRPSTSTAPTTWSRPSAT
jgi:threonine dehydrogenase-like Zn-dependent dehydrogenase